MSRRSKDASSDWGVIIDNLHESIITTDADGYITNWNKGAERLFGYRILKNVDTRFSPHRFEPSWHWCAGPEILAGLPPSSQRQIFYLPATNCDIRTTLMRHRLGTA